MALVPSRMREAEFFRLMDELNLFHVVGYSEDGKVILLGMTPIQQVAVAAALLAYFEGES